MRQIAGGERKREMQPRYRTGADPLAGRARRTAGRLRRAVRRAWHGWWAYERRLDRDPVRRERSAMVVIGAAALVVVLAMVVLVVMAGRGNRPPRARSAGLIVGSSTPPRTVPSTPPVTASPTPTEPPTPTVPAGGSLRALHSGRCLAVPGGSRAEGTRLVQRLCDGDPGEGFHLVPVQGAADTYLLVDAASGQCVDVSGASIADAAEVIQWSCHSGPNQQFTLRQVAGLAGYVQVVAAHSGKCLDVTDASTAEGAPVQQWSCHPPDVEAGMRNQSWLVAGG